MNLSHIDQVIFAYLALKFVDKKEVTAPELDVVLAFGELMKQYSSEDNATIFDITEYLYEQQRLLRHDKGAINDESMKEQLKSDIAQHLKNISL